MPELLHAYSEVIVLQLAPHPCMSAWKKEGPLELNWAYSQECGPDQPQSPILGSSTPAREETRVGARQSHLLPRQLSPAADRYLPHTGFHAHHSADV